MNNKIFSVLLISCFFFQGVAHTAQESNKAIKNWKEFLKKSPLPENNVELKKLYEITNQGQIAPDLYLKLAWNMVLNNENELYVSDWGTNKIFKFNLKGKYLSSYGRTGQGPKDLFKPFSVILYKDYIVVNDNGNRRLVYLDKNGDYIKSFKIYNLSPYSL